MAAAEVGVGATVGLVAMARAPERKRRLRNVRVNCSTFHRRYARGFRMDQPRPTDDASRSPLSPARLASSAASVRLETPSLSRMCVT